MDIECSWSRLSGNWTTNQKGLIQIWIFQDEKEAFIRVQETVVMNQGTVLYFCWNAVLFLVKFLTFDSFLLCQQVPHFKLEQRSLFSRVTLNGGLYRIPSLSVQMLLLYPTHLLSFDPYFPSPFSLSDLLSFSSNTSHPNVFPFTLFFSSLSVYMHLLFYFLMYFFLNSFIIGSASPVTPTPTLCRPSFSKSVLKWAYPCVYVGDRKVEKICNVFSNFLFFPLNNLNISH